MSLAKTHLPQAAVRHFRPPSFRPGKEDEMLEVPVGGLQAGEHLRRAAEGVHQR